MSSKKILPVKNQPNKTTENRKKTTSRQDVKSKSNLPTGKLLVFGIIIILITLSAYWRPAFFSNIPRTTTDSTMIFQFTNFDDNLYINDNPFLRSLDKENWKLIFSNYYMGNYHPISMLSLAFNYKFAEFNPWRYHFTNVFFHILNTLLLFWFIYKLINYLYPSDKRNWGLELGVIVSALFGVHTLHIESVAWVSERKDVLYTLFYIWGMITYLNYVIYRKTKDYLFTFLLFILSCLSKGQAVAFAVSIFAIDYLLNRDFKEKCIDSAEKTKSYILFGITFIITMFVSLAYLGEGVSYAALGMYLFISAATVVLIFKLQQKFIVEKLPFIFTAIVVGVVAIYAQKSSESIGTGANWAFWQRILFASYGFSQYFIKLVFPINLSVFHPYPRYDQPLPVEFYFMPIIVLAILGGMFYAWKKDYKLTVFGIVFFIINIFLVLQLLPVGKAIMADRYTYVASIGFYILVAVLYRYVTLKNEKFILPMQVVVASYTIMLCVLTYARTPVWRTSLALWEDVLQLYPNSELAHNNKGDILSNLNRPEEALKHFNRALELDSVYDQTYYNRGVVRARLGFKIEALQDFTTAIRLRPNYPEAYSNRGATKFELGNRAEALPDFDKAIELKPNYTIAYSNRGSAKAMLGDPQGAIQDFKSALGLDQSNGKIWFMFGLTSLSIGNKPEGCNALQQAANLGFKEAFPELQKNCR